MKPPISKAIDPKRTGISKSAIVATSLCARKGWFGEQVRDSEGRRLSVPMPERVLFGTALDEATSLFLWNIREGHPANLALIEEAVEEGLAAMASRPGAEDLDAMAIGTELWGAMELFRLEIVQGLLQPLYGERLDGLKLQGNDGESLRHGEFIGTPDILVLGEKPAIWDVKSSPRSKTERDLWSPEMAHYASLFMGLYGDLPLIGYLTWVRTKSPKWQVLSRQSTVLHLSLAQAHRSVTKASLAASVESLPFSTALCGTCEWKTPRPELGFGGCQIGQAIDELGEEVEG